MSDILSNLTGQWDFDGSLASRSPSNAFTVGAGSVAYQNGVIGLEASLGTSDRLDSADAAGIDVGAGESFSVAGWFTLGARASSQDFISKQSSWTSASSPGYSIYAFSDNRLGWLVSDGGGRSIVLANSVFATDTRVFVVCTLDRSDNTMHIYKDGGADIAGSVLIDPVADMGSLESSTSLFINRGTACTAKAGNLWIFKRALSEAESAALYRLRPDSKTTNRAINRATHRSK